MTNKTLFKRRSVLLFFFCVILGILPLVVSAQQETGALMLPDEDRRKFDHYFYEAMNAKAQGKYDEAMDLLQYCHVMDSTNANVLVELGTFHNILQEKNKALTFFRKAVSYDASNYYYNMMLAGLSKELGLKQDVVDIYSMLSKLYPNKPDLQFELANAYADNGELQKAIDTLNKLERVLVYLKSLPLINTVSIHR